MNDYMSKMGSNEIQEMTGDEVNKITVKELVTGIADIIGMPESPDDLDKNLTQRVLWIEAQTFDGERHSLCFLPREAELIDQALNQYKQMLMTEMMDGQPDKIRDLLQILDRLLRDNRDGEE